MLVKYIKRAFTLARSEIGLLHIFASDYWRFRKHAAPFRRFSNDSQRHAFLLMLLHSIEKGLALPSPKDFFGQDKRDLIIRTYNAIRFDDKTRWLHCYTLNVMTTYLDHLVSAAAAPPEYIESIRQFTDSLQDKQPKTESIGGTIETKSSHVPKWTRDEVVKFFESRHSTRKFRKGTINKEPLLLASQMAQSGPSACNRHPCKVHFIEKGETMERVLEMQKGNRGFGTEFSQVAVVTCDLSAALDATERNQPWVEGGLFSMSLILAFHSMGYGTCSLNWSAELAQDDAIRATGIVKEQDCVIMLIGLGLLRERYTVAASTRAKAELLTTFHS